MHKPKSAKRTAPTPRQLDEMIEEATVEFSLARKRISSCAREHLLRAQRIARIRKTRDDVFMRNTRVVAKDIGLAPSVGHKADHEFNRKPRPADDRFASEHAGGERNARMLRHRRSATPFSEADITRTRRARRCQNFTVRARSSRKSENDLAMHASCGVVLASSIIAPRRSNSAHLHRPWRATLVHAIAAEHRRSDAWPDAGPADGRHSGPLLATNFGVPESTFAGIPSVKQSLSA